jgi:predicted MPP superfamily phosphohydrolase
VHVGPLEFSDYLVACVTLTAVLGVAPFAIPKRGHTIRRFLIAALIVTVTTACAVAPLGPGSFEGLHVVYGILTWSIPAIGLAAIIAALVQRTCMRRSIALPIAAIMLLPAPVGFYATNIEPRSLVVDHYEVDPKALGAMGVRVVVISDIQSPGVGEFERKAARTAAEQQGDLILSPGDLYSGEDDPFPEHFDAFTELVSTMDAPFGTYVVPGDHDGDEMLPAIVKAAGKTFLQEELREVQVQGRRIGILGLDTDYRNFEAPRLMRDLAAREDLDYKIVLSHKPDVIFDTPTGIDLVVAGHTHGGQVNLPFIGPLVTLSEIPRAQAAGGLFDYPGERKLFVTRGIGVEHGNAPVVRFNAKPQVAVLHLHIP